MSLYCFFVPTVYQTLLRSNQGA